MVFFMLENWVQHRLQKSPFSKYSLSKAFSEACAFGGNDSTQSTFTCGLKAKTDRNSMRFRRKTRKCERGLSLFMRPLVRFHNVRQLAFIDSCNPLTPSVRHKGHLRTKNQSEKKGKTRREQRTKEKKFGHSRVKDFSMLSS